jgi:hypothetical protein
MRIARFTVAALCIGITMAACQKDADRTGKAKPQNNFTEKADDPISLLFRAYREQNTETTQFNGLQGTEFVAADGTTITVEGSALTRPDGSVETGTVTLSYFGINDVADQALGGAPTQSRWREGAGSDRPSGGPIVTAGAMEIKMFNQQGQPLTSQGDGVKVDVPVDPQTGFDDDMSLWDGVPSPNQPRDNVWDETTDPVDPGDNGDTYSFRWERNGQLNLDKIRNCPGQLTNYRVFMPNMFNRSNTEIYAIVPTCYDPNVPNMVISLDLYNASPKFWAANPGANLVVGTTVTFVSISSIGGQYYYGSNTVTVTPGMTVSITNSVATPLSTIMSNLAAF